LVYLHQPVLGGVLDLSFGEMISELLVLSVVVSYSHLSHNHFSLSTAKLSLLLLILFLSFLSLGLKSIQNEW
jgi:ethanolamine transporter EutH